MNLIAGFLISIRVAKVGFRIGFDKSRMYILIRKHSQVVGTKDVQSRNGACLLYNGKQMANILLVAGKDGTTTEDVGYIGTINVGDCLLESGDFFNGRVLRELEFKVFRLFAVPRPDEIADPGKPRSAIGGLRSGDRFGGDGEAEG